MISGLQNDFKSLTTEIDAKLQILHQNRRASGSLDTPMDVESEEQRERRRLPIARVNLVSEGSPAYHAVSFIIALFYSVQFSAFQNSF